MEIQMNPSKVLTKEKLSEMCNHLSTEANQLEATIKEYFTELNELDAQFSQNKEDIIHFQKLARDLVNERNQSLMQLAEGNRQCKTLLSTPIKAGPSNIPASQTTNDLRHMPVDGSVYLHMQCMCHEIHTCTQLIEKAHKDYEAWKSTADSQVGNRVIARIRKLQQENEDLANKKYFGHTAKLESEIALRTGLSDLLKHASNDMQSIVDELDNENDTFQESIQLLNGQLAVSKLQIDDLAALLETYEPGEVVKIFREHDWPYPTFGSDEKTEDSTAEEKDPPEQDNAQTCLQNLEKNADLPDNVQSDRTET